MSQSRIPLPKVDVKPVEAPAITATESKKSGWLSRFLSNTAQDFSEISAQINAEKPINTTSSLDLNQLFFKNASNSKTNKLLLTLLGFVAVMFLLFFAVKFSKK